MKSKILIVGNWMWPWYEKACADALKSLGCEVVTYSWFAYFYKWNSTSVEPSYKSQLARIQNRFLLGPSVSKLNSDIIQLCIHEQPDILWFFNCTHVFPSTYRKLKSIFPKTLLVQYANDNPFGNHVKPDRWRYLKRSLPFFDVNFVYRDSNTEDLNKLGAKNIHLLRSYYIPEEDYHERPQSVKFLSDVVFAGHFESDGRLGMLAKIASCGYKVNLYGGGWKVAEPLIPGSNSLFRCFPVQPVVGSEYRQAICGAKIALCFLSKLNMDTYTRRSFQIPAMKTFMLSEYSADLAAMFEEGVEAEFFRSQEELIDKIRFYLARDAIRDQIAEAGYRKVKKDGHDVKNRMKYFLQWTTKYLKEI